MAREEKQRWRRIKDGGDVVTWFSHVIVPLGDCVTSLTVTQIMIDESEIMKEKNLVFFIYRRAGEILVNKIISIELCLKISTIIPHLKRSQHNILLRIDRKSKKIVPAHGVGYPNEISVRVPSIPNTY